MVSIKSQSVAEIVKFWVKDRSLYCYTNYKLLKGGEIYFELAKFEVNGIDFCTAIQTIIFSKEEKFLSASEIWS